ncbi:MAG TPA: hypothetical protein VL172_10140, partial [Kofleriaceae bacterium]|nr:hypothetical protein [Kofleriaceae bacterium]
MALAAALPGHARAQERWLLSADAPAAFVVSQPQQRWFSSGAVPGVGVYRSLGPALLLGARLRGGVLGEGAGAGDPTLMDKGTGGLASLSAAVRLRPLPGSAGRAAGPWLELAAGGALTGRDLRPAAELGVGWGLMVGRVALGPSLRYLHVVQPD